MAGQIFSFPKFFASGNWSVSGYNVLYSAPTSSGSGLIPNAYGPWEPLTGYQNTLQNTDIVDAAGTYWTLYRIEPILEVTGPSGPTSITLQASNPFKATDQLYDTQISQLLQSFRDAITDQPTHQVDSTQVAETTGMSVMPFVTDAETSRFYPAFLPGSNPVRFIPESVQVFNGTLLDTAAALVPYSDFNPAGEYGYVDFKENPTLNSYLKIEYDVIRYGNTQLRSYLTNAVSQLSSYGINGYQVTQSNNLSYLTVPVANNDLSEIIVKIAYWKLLNAQIQESAEHAESWKDGNTSFTADPSRILTAAVQHLGILQEEVRVRATQYILANRTYYAKGEIGSYFDTTGVLPVYTMIVAGFGQSNLGLWWV